MRSDIFVQSCVANHFKEQCNIEIVVYVLFCRYVEIIYLNAKLVLIPSIPNQSKVYYAQNEEMEHYLIKNEALLVMLFLIQLLDRS